MATISTPPNLTTTDGEGYECPECGCDHAPRFGPCFSCRRAHEQDHADRVRRFLDGERLIREGTER